MNKIDSVLQTMSLFDHIQQSNYSNVLCCLKSQLRKYQKGEIICGLQEPILSAGIVLSGKVKISFISKNGFEHNIKQFEKGDLFGEAFACISKRNSTVQISALQRSQILFLCFSELFTKKAYTCPYASQVTQNLLREVAKKNIFLNNKVEMLAQRKIRDRLYIYLKTLNQSNISTIKIPLNRQELASYLGVDRSALSRELCSMRDEGILLFDKNKITVLRSEMLLWSSEKTDTK